MEGAGEEFADRQHILYVNASYESEDDLGRLMHDFLCSDPDEMYTPMMAEKARYLKEDPKGVEIMCKAMEEMRDEVERRTTEKNRIDAIKSIMKKLRYTAEQAMDLLDIPASDQPKYAAKL